MKIGSFAACAVLAALGLLSAQRPPLSPEEKSVSDRMGQLRSLPDDQWVKAVGELAAQIHAMPAGSGKSRLAIGLANLATEGDAGRPALQNIADAIAEAIPGLAAAQRPQVCGELASLARYEHLKVTLDDPAYRDAVRKLDQEDQQRANADFTLSDIKGKAWKLSDLRGKVVLVNFWATWCPPCRKEMPDMQALYERFGSQGLVILAISDETHDKVDPFIADKKYTYPILLDTDKKVNAMFSVTGIPKSFVYDRSGKMAAVAIDRRTMGQFLDMLKRAGLE
jgi:peroxiredoxin